MMEVKPDPAPELTSVFQVHNLWLILIVNSLRSGLALAGAALAYFVTVGFLNAFGIFQEYYTSVILRDLSEFQISWLASSPGYNRCLT